ncbi:otogelin-like [Oncorhynchus mykiss]|uniref:otogelin-like n=1 Tax=Oncorhynchus mykiss TaxID=8022 RepID=UPI0018781F44|nr:otogelin-like [Oncorhynchus mykiss]
MACRSWGQYNYETFDGLYYHFPGRCTYTLLRDCEDTSQASILIQVHNDPDCRSSPYSCTRSVSLFLPWEGEIRLHRSKVTFKGQSVQLPHHIHDVELERISRYVLVTQQHGFTLAWDGHSGSVYIKLSPEWVGRTCGLCGNFNADVQDDLKTSYGVVTEDLSMFGNSWVEEELHQVRCPMVPFMFPSSCASRDPHILLVSNPDPHILLVSNPDPHILLVSNPDPHILLVSNPDPHILLVSNPDPHILLVSNPDPHILLVSNPDPHILLLSNPAPHILLVSNPDPHILLVSNPDPHILLVSHPDPHILLVSNPDPHILLVSNPDPHILLVSNPDPHIVFTEYARVCAHADHPLTDWRTHIPQCAMPCPPGLQYKECITCCPVSCNVDRMCIDNKLQCLDGCYCPDGECSVTGDMYFHSFDGRMFTFPASCQYVLAKSRNSGKFTVTIQNAPCGPHLDGSCIQSVSLVIDEDPRTEITLTHLGEVFMAGQYRISLPYSDEVFHIQELSSMYLQLRTALGLHLQYSWREFRLYLQVDELWKGDTVGLCGTFNGNIQDDFLSPSGMIESTPHLFGNAWRVSSACVPSQSVPQLDPCDTHQQAASYASEMCDILNQELFSACHEYLSPVPFHQQCKADTCKCGQPCLCSSLAHYARQCRKYSVITEFRASVPDCEVTCPDTMEYGTCVSSCQRRCSALSTQQHCGEEYQQCPLGQMYLDCTEGLEGLKAIDGISLGRGLGCEHTCESHLLNLTCSAHEPCIPGCVCPPGLLKHGDECFEPDACPCLWKGKEYYPGDRVTSPCHQCVCQHGTFQCVFRPCPSMCTAYGDRHYRTFDGLLFDYVGVCKVYLVKSSADLMMSVTAENVDCYDSGVICRKSLLINIGRSFIAFDDDSGKPNPSSVIDWRQEVFIWSAGLFTVVHVPEEDLTVLWDRKTTVHIQAGPRWQGKLSGLCGNFDLRTVNEMRTPENIDSATPQEFGNSWTAAECVNSPDIRHPCSLNPLREPFSKRQCGVLLSEVFLVCHPVVDVTWFYMNCLADTCGCSRGGDCECFCTSVAAYAHRCCHQGVTVDWRSPSICPYDCEYYNKVLGKGPYRLVTYRERDTVLAANRSSGTVFPKKGDPAAAGFLSLFMMTPGLSRVRPHDTSLVSFEASDRPNYFLAVDSSGHLTLTKWEESEAFWDAATFTLHRDTWIQGYDSLEALARPGFFLHYMLSWIHLMKYKHTDGFRKATLFKLTGPGPDTPTGPKCQWRYESCVSPCFRTCSDPSGRACGTVPKVEGCLPLCPGHMVLDEVTQRCVHVEDCIKPPVAVQPITTVSSVESTPAAVTPSATTTTTRSSPASPGLSTARSTPGPPAPLTTTSIQPPYTTTPSDTVPTTAATTTTIPIVSTSALDALTTSAKFPTTVTDKVVLPSTSSAVPTPEGTSAASTPSLATAVRPEVVEVVSTVKTSPSLPSTTEGSTERTTRAPSSSPSPLGPSTERTSQVPFSITALFWLTSSTTRPSLRPGTTDTTFTSPPPSTTMGPWISSTVGPTQTSALPAVPVTPTSVTTKATTRPGDTHREGDHTCPSETCGQHRSRRTSPRCFIYSARRHHHNLSYHDDHCQNHHSSARDFNRRSFNLQDGETSCDTRTPGRAWCTWGTSIISHHYGPHDNCPTFTWCPYDHHHTCTWCPSDNCPTFTWCPYDHHHTCTWCPSDHCPTFTWCPSDNCPTFTWCPSDHCPTFTWCPYNHHHTCNWCPYDHHHTCTWCPSDHCPTFTWCPYDHHHTCTWCPSDHCPTFTWCPYDHHHTCTWCPSDHCPTFTWCPYDHHHTCTWCPSDHCPTFTWCPYDQHHTCRSHSRGHTKGHAKGHTRCDSSSLSPRLAPHGHLNLHPRAREGGRSRHHCTKDSITITCVAVHHIRDNRATIGSIAIYHDRACWNYGRDSMGLNVGSMEINVGSMGLNPPYSEIIDECTKFLCVSGQLVRFNMSQNCLYNSTPPNCGLLGFAILVNGDKCCPQWDCPCRCSVFPDLNVITFDGNSVAIYKATSYIVTQLPIETVSIVVQECPADSDTVRMRLLWNFTNLCLVVLNITHKSNHLVINRLQRRLYVNSRYAKPRFKKFGFEILDTGNMYLIRTPAGLKLQWFHSTGMLVIETESYNSKLPTMGLCGCCDGNPANDLMLSNGTTVGESEDPAVFIDSWQVPNTTSYISHSRRREVNCSTSDCSQCMTMLRNTSFSPCHAFVPPSTFCEVWVRDAEYVNNPCVALAAYVASCHKFNVCMEWRSPDYCPFMCPDRLRYQACLPTCTALSCSNHDFDHDPEQCTGLTEGCVCPEGTLLHRPYSALCIPPEKCACTDSSGVPRAPGEVWKASKDGCCMYRCDNDSIVPVEYNCSAVSQPLCRRAGEVVVSLADDTSCCPQKACVCNQTLCDIFPPECQYGEKLVSYFREDSCCPDYVCECDPERCESDVPACREDQTLIATRADGSCCLAHICMCGSCLEVVPNCQDGEVLTVDANSTDLCCPVFHCVCEPYRCAELSCPLGMSAVTVSPPDHCCPLHTCVREAVCVDGERGVMHPGQTLVDHSQEGVCLTTQCSHSLDPTTGFHLLRTATTNCSAQCQPNQIYIPPKDQMMCCGVCRNISCLYHNDNGTTLLYKPGKSWVSDCMKYDCTDTLSGPTLVSYSFSCPPFNQTECMKIGGTIVSYMDGCCKTCKEDGKSCQKVTVRMTIRKNDCRSNRPVNIVSCDGKCPSASIYNYNINTYARFCKCCREMGLQRRSVQLYCSGNSTWVNYSIQEPTDCSCQWS